MRSDKFRQTVFGILLFAALTLAEGGPVRDTSAHLTGWPPAPTSSLSAPVDTSSQSRPAITGPILAPKWEGKAEPGRAGECIQSAAIAFGGVLLAGTGIAYWMHFSDANNYMERHGVSIPLVLPVFATVAIPVGVLMTGFGTMDFFTRLVHIGSDD